MTIKSGDFVLFELPSTNSKLIQVKAKESIDLGKYGTFDADLLIGQSYGWTFELIGDALEKKDLELNEFEIDLETIGSNQTINDLGHESQKLSFQDIEKMKESSVSGQEIIQSMIENHSEFEKKTAFAKMKYLKRKTSKFIKAFTPQRPTARRLLQYFLDKNSSRVKEIRVDTLSQIITSLNVRAGCRLLTVDDTNGIIVAAILERLQGCGLVFNMSEHEMGKLDAPKYLNYESDLLNYIMFPWHRINKQPDEEIDLEDLKKDVSPEGIKKFERMSKKIEVLSSRRSQLLDENFDGLVIASHLNPIQVLTQLRPFLKGSVPVVIYGQYKESLYEAYSFIRSSTDYVDCQLSESWMREYQIPSGKGGMHPFMMTPGRSGYLLTAITAISPKEDIIPMHSKRQKVR